MKPKDITIDLIKSFRANGNNHKADLYLDIYHNYIEEEREKDRLVKKNQTAMNSYYNKCIKRKEQSK